MIYSRLYRFALWLIRLRWLGVVCIALVTRLSARILDISVHETGLYLVSVAFLLLNIIHRFWLWRISRQSGSGREKSLRLLTNFQISTDFLALTVMLHFSGGIENPFIIYYIFHMIMAGIVLTPADSFLQVTFALMLTGGLTFTEYAGVLPHHPLTGFVSHDLYMNKLYLMATGAVFITTSYLVWYITNSIVMQSRRHEEAYLQANRELEKKDAIKNEYVLRITHDIKGHLAAIHSNLSVLQSKPEGKVSPDSREFLDRAARRTSILIGFVRDLLYLTKLKLNSELRAAPFSLRESIEKVIAGLESQAGSKSIRIEVRADDTVDQITGYQLSIEELIANLLGNAVKYSGDGSEVRVYVKRLEDRILIQVEDNGPGIPPGEQEMIFEEFYRGSHTGAGTEGTGLGLAIARKIVQAHGGRIWVESTGESGSTFCFTLPAHDAPPESSSP